MNKKNQFIQFGLGMLGFKSKQDLIENLFIKSIYDTYRRVDKTLALKTKLETDLYMIFITIAHC